VSRDDRRRPDRTRPVTAARSVARKRAPPQPAVESEEAFFAELELAGERADAWLERIAREGAHPGLLVPPVPHGSAVCLLLARARDRAASDPELAENVALVALAFIPLLPPRRVGHETLVADALRVLATACRVRAQLDAAEAYTSLVRAVLPEGYSDPTSQAETLIEEAELLAARRRFPEAIEKGREALAIYAPPLFESGARKPILARIAAWVAAPSSTGPSSDRRR
jgi:hypothetical protein